MEQFFAMHFQYRMPSVAWRMRNANQSVYYVYDSVTHVGILRSGAAGCVSASVYVCVCVCVKRTANLGYCRFFGF